MALRIQWNMDALKEIRMSGLGMVEDYVDTICDSANGMSGGGYEFEAHESGGAGRARGTVFTDNPRAMVVERRDNNLIRALGSSG